MTHVLQIALCSLRDVSRNRWGLLYTAFFTLATTGLFQLQAHAEKVAVSLMSLCLVLTPLVSVVFGTLHFYNLREFIELMLTQPVRRRDVYLGIYLGLATALVASLFIGIGVPWLLFGLGGAGQALSLLVLLLIGSALTVIFLGVAFLLATLFDDRGKGIAAALAIWLVSALLYDGVVLFIATEFSDYPLEKPLLVISFLNPIDLARVTLLVQSDMAALMGYTGAVFNRFFGTSLGVIVAGLSLLAWIVMPVATGLSRFRRKDF